MVHSIGEIDVVARHRTPCKVLEIGGTEHLHIVLTDGVHIHSLASECGERSRRYQTWICLREHSCEVALAINERLSLCAIELLIVESLEEGLIRVAGLDDVEVVDSNLEIGQLIYVGEALPVFRRRAIHSHARVDQ